jgi:hypothetical protein
LRGEGWALAAINADACPSTGHVDATAAVKARGEHARNVDATRKARRKTTGPRPLTKLAHTDQRLIDSRVLFMSCFSPIHGTPRPR